MIDKEIIKIKNPKIFNCDMSKPYHWSKLPKLKEVMHNKAVDLSGADLSFANLCFANLTEAVLSQANLNKALLGGANLTKANLTRANLNGAILSEADLSFANLFGANLTEAVLILANLTEANLRGANLNGTDLNGTDLSMCCINTGTKGLDVIAIGNLGCEGKTYFYYPQIDKINSDHIWGTPEEFEKAINIAYKGEVLEKFLKAIEIFKSCKK